MLGCKAHPCLESSLPGPTGCARFASAPCCSRACTASCLRGFTWRGGEGKGERAFAVMKTSLKPKGSKPKANHTTKPDTVTALKPSDNLRSPGSGFSEHPRLHSFETPDFGLASFFTASTSGHLIWISTLAHLQLHFLPTDTCFSCIKPSPPSPSSSPAPGGHRGSCVGHQAPARGGIAVLTPLRIRPTLSSSVCTLGLNLLKTDPSSDSSHGESVQGFWQGTAEG